ncbi:hypothetical protein CHUAL_012564 [Chamberlinius hualienensis]
MIPVEDLYLKNYTDFSKAFLVENYDFHRLFKKELELAKIKRQYIDSAMDSGDDPRSPRKIMKCDNDSLATAKLKIEKKENELLKMILSIPPLKEADSLSKTVGMDSFKSQEQQDDVYEYLAVAGTSKESITPLEAMMRYIKLNQSGDDHFSMSARIALEEKMKLDWAIFIVATVVLDTKTSDQQQIYGSVKQKIRHYGVSAIPSMLKTLNWKCVLSNPTQSQENNTNFEEINIDTLNEDVLNDGPRSSPTQSRKNDETFEENYFDDTLDEDDESDDYDSFIDTSGSLDSLDSFVEYLNFDLTEVDVQIEID